MNNNTKLIAAMGTPLTDDQALHTEGFERHIDDVIQAGLDAMLVGGTMGNMQLLNDVTYQDMARQASAGAQGQSELFIGAGDTSFARTRDKIHWLNNIAIDGITILAPYFEKYTQEELIQYYLALADEAKKPLFLYDLPARAGVALSIPTVLKLAEHPNIKGAKCSGDLGLARYLYEQSPQGFRIQVAQPNLLDILISAGLPEHVDGMYALAPQWTDDIRKAAEVGDTNTARKQQMKLSGLLMLLIKYGIMPAFTALMNAREIPGSFAPRPATPLSDEAKEQLLSDPLVIELIAESQPAALTA